MQEYNDWELLIIDDGSEPSYRQRNLYLPADEERVVFHFTEHAERSAARNYGVTRARGKWICFLDSDDYLLPHYLQAFRTEIGENTVKIILNAGQYLEMDGNRKMLPRLENGSHPLIAIWRGRWNIMGFCFPKEVFEKVRFPELYSFWEDRSFLLRAVTGWDSRAIDASTSVIVDHSERSVHRLGNISGRDRAEDIINCIDDTFRSREGIKISAQIEKWMIRREKARRVIGIANDALNENKHQEVVTLLVLALNFIDFRTLPSWLNTMRKVFIGG